MIQYVLRRTIRLILVVFSVITVVFLLMFLSGDPAAVMAPPDATQADIETLRALLGFDRPFHVQYIEYITRALQGDFGTSIRYDTQALPFVLERLPATLLLTLFATFWMLVIAIPTGILSALFPNSWVDSSGRLLA